MDPDGGQGPVGTGATSCRHDGVCWGGSRLVVCTCVDCVVGLVRRFKIGDSEDYPCVCLNGPEKAHNSTDGNMGPIGPILGQ